MNHFQYIRFRGVLISGLLGLMGSSFALPTLAKPGRGGKMSEMQALNLSTEQREAMTQFRDEFQKKSSGLKNDLAEKRSEFKKLKAGSASDQELKKKHDELESIRSKISDLRFEHQLKMRNLLSPEQRQQWAESMENSDDSRKTGDRGRRGSREF